MDNLTRPDPDTAYAQWTQACAHAGWQPRDGAQASADGDRDTEQVPLADGLGRVTARLVTARWPSPREDCAAMDGIAIGAGSLNWGGVLEDTASGLRVAPADFTWIDTGDPLPPGTDTVIKREQVTVDGDGYAVIGLPATGPGAQNAENAMSPACLQPGHHVRRRGEDFAAGQVLVPEGRRLRPADLAVAASAGHPVITVTRQPSVVIIPTGDEIRSVDRLSGGPLSADALPADTLPKSGEIIDSNSVWLAARCVQAGARPAVTGIIPDDPDLLAAALREAAVSADLVLVIAGSSRGRDDYTGAVLAQVGGLTVTGVAVRPGHPAILGYAKSPVTGTVPVVGLPGYPIATAVTFELFAAPLLAEIQGDETKPVLRPATLAKGWTSKPGIEEWVPVMLSQDGSATPAGHGASSTSHLATATAWWRIPPGRSHFPPGSEITVRPWD
ncbi:MAG TPA: molybdopterin molybdotransferase MoeA [Trebonia sp.]|jgi:putative molybdopterin biosynthesis protein